jgi:hypothetical protein
MWEGIMLIRKDRSYSAACIAPGTRSRIGRIGRKICIAGIGKRAEMLKQGPTISVYGACEHSRIEEEQAIHWVMVVVDAVRAERFVKSLL